jgi:hypothetical protein
MSTKVSQVAVATPEQMDQTISSYIAQGFTVMNRGATTTTMFKQKEFKVIWAVIGFLLCLLPLLVYLIVYALEKDQMVEIKLLPAGYGGQEGAIQMSGDGRYWWDGTAWQDVQSNVPPSAQRSDDGAWWWDGSTWHAVPGEAQSGPPVALPPRADQPEDAASEPDAGSTRADHPRDGREEA